MKKNEHIFRDKKDTVKGTSICVIGIPEGEEKKETKFFFK